MHSVVYHALESRVSIGGHATARTAAARSPIGSTALIACGHALACAGVTMPTGTRLRSWSAMAEGVAGTRLARLWPLLHPTKPPVGEACRKRKLQPEPVDGAGHGAAGGQPRSSKAHCAFTAPARLQPPPAATLASAGVHGPQRAANRCPQGRTGAAADAQPEPAADGGVNTPAADTPGRPRLDDVGADAWLHACRIVVAAAATDDSCDPSAPWAAAALQPEATAACPDDCVGPIEAAVSDAEYAQGQHHTAPLLRAAAALSAIDVQLRSPAAGARAAEAREELTAHEAACARDGPMHPCVTTARLAQCVPTEMFTAAGAGDAAAAACDEAAESPRFGRSSRHGCARVHPACLPSAQVAVIFAPVATDPLARCALASLHILALTRWTAGVGESLASDEFPAWAWDACCAALSATLPDIASLRPLVRRPESLWRSWTALTVLSLLLEHCAESVDSVAREGHDAATAAELAAAGGGRDGDGDDGGRGDRGEVCRAVLGVACMAATRAVLALAACRGELEAEQAAPSLQQEQVRSHACAACNRNLYTSPMRHSRVVLPMIVCILRPERASGRLPR